MVVAVLNKKPRIFLYHLLANNIETTFPNKLRFYEFFKHMLEYAYQISTGPMYLKIETPEYEKEGYIHYCFYDKYHIHSRFYFKLKLSGSKLVIDITPI